MSAPIGVFGRSCPHCGELCPPGLAAHLDCALQVTRAQVVAAAEQRATREQREERAKLDAAAGTAARAERKRIVGVLRERARALRIEGSQCTQAATLQALAQRAAALDEAATLIEEG